MKGISPCLWFDTEAEPAAKFYTSVFKNSRITGISHYGEDMPMPAGTVLTVTFELDGQEFIALNGGPEFQFTQAVSFMVICEGQQEIDDYWAKLTAGGGEESQCGWLKDKYGLSWQVVPTIVQEMLKSKDPAKSQRVLHAVMKMVKLDAATLQRAFDGTG